MSTVIQNEPFVQKLPGSALRHRPIHTETGTQDVTILKPRASQAKSSHVSDTHTTSVPLAVPLRRNRMSRSGTWLIYLVLGMLMAMIVLWVGQSIWNWGNTVADDLHYGRPRTTNVDQFVGHETGKMPSHFIAINLNGQIYVVEIPGGSANTSHLLIGPHLIGPDAGLAPISLSFPGDSRHPDLLITVDNIQMHFHNNGTAYVPAS